jgi:hypothetical protein
MNVERRGFFKSLGAMIAGIALGKTKIQEKI